MAAPPPAVLQSQRQAVFRELQLKAFVFQTQQRASIGPATSQVRWLLRRAGHIRASIQRWSESGPYFEKAPEYLLCVLRFGDASHDDYFPKLKQGYFYGFLQRSESIVAFLFTDLELVIVGLKLDFFARVGKPMQGGSLMGFSGVLNLLL